MFGIGALLGAAAVAGLAGGATNYILGSSAARDAVDESISGSETLSRWNALELPRLQMAGLEKAGLNPILTAGNLGSAAAQVQAPINPNSAAIGDAISGLPSNLMHLSQGLANIGQIKANTMATQANVQMGQQRLAIESARAQADVAKVEQEKLESAARTMQMLSKDDKGEYWFNRINKARADLLKKQAEAAGRDTTFNFGGFKFSLNAGDLFGKEDPNDRSGKPVTATSAKTNSEEMFVPFSNSAEQAKKDLDRFQSDPNFGERFLKSGEMDMWRWYQALHKSSGKSRHELWKDFLEQQEFYRTRSGMPPAFKHAIQPHINSGNFFLDHGMN